MDNIIDQPSTLATDSKTKQDPQPIKDANKQSEIVNLYDLFDISTANKFKNKDYILKFSNQSNLKFAKDEVTVKYSGKGASSIDYATVQSNNPINKLDPIFYFEVEIIDEGSKKDITVGFSDKEVILNKQCGTISKSYGYNGDGKKYHDDSKEQFGPKFKVKDVIGCGFYFSKKSIFFTYNGKFLGYAFDNVDMNGTYYPTISLHSLNECVVANFGRSNYIFDIEGYYINQTKLKLNDILLQETKIKDLDYIVREYLVHSGYQETFNSMELERNQNDTTEDIINPETNNNLERKISEHIQDIQNNHKMEIDGEDNELIGKYSKDNEAPEVRKRTLSIMLDRMNDDQSEPDVFLIMNFLKERKIIQNMLMGKDYDSALEYFIKYFGEYSTKKEVNYKKIIVCLSTLKYLDKLKANDFLAAFEILNSLDRSYWAKDIAINLYDANDKIIDKTIDQLSELICYQNISEGELNYYFSEKESVFLANQINSLILELPGLSNESVLEKLLKQQMLLNYSYNVVKNSPGEVIKIKIN